MKILHIADCHLDSPLRGLPSNISDMRRHQLAGAFSDALSYASENKTEVVLISGDMFDTPTASHSSVGMLTSFAAANPEVYIFVAPGNHDCVLGNNYIAPLSAYPNIKVFTKGYIEKVELPQFNACIYGVGCVHAHGEERLLENFWVDEADKLNIMCFHGLVYGYGGHDAYNPLSREDMAQSGLDYIALGHVHTFSGVQSLGLVNYAYPGCLLGRGFDETGAKGFIAGNIEKGSCELEFIESKYPAFERVFVDCNGAKDMVEIIAKVNKAVEMLPDSSLLSVVLEGYIRSDLVVNRSIVSGSLSRFAFVKTDDKTKPEQDYVALSGEQSLKGIFLKNVLESGADEITIRKAVSLGLAALSGEELNMDEY